jgi:hypothetical protein
MPFHVVAGVRTSLHQPEASMNLRYILQLCASLTLVSCSSKATVTTGGSDHGAVQRLGVANARNETPVLASSGRWVVSVWTATRQSKSDVYAATSSEDGRHFSVPVRVNDVGGEAHVYGEDPPRVAMAAVDPAIADAVPSIVVVWPSDRAKQLGMRSARSMDGGKTIPASMSVGDPAAWGSEASRRSPSAPIRERTRCGSTNVVIRAHRIMQTPVMTGIR